MKIKVLHIITTLDVGGAETMLWKLLSSMDKEVFTSQVICLRPAGPLAGRIQDLEIPVRSLNMRRGRPDPRTLLSLTAIMRRFRPDIVQTWLYHADFMGFLAARMLGFHRIVWNIRCSNMDFRRYHPFTFLVFKLCAKLSRWPRAIISNSESALKFHVQSGYQGNRFRVIPNGFDLETFKPDPPGRGRLLEAFSLPSRAFLIGMVARYDPMKGHQIFLEAATAVARKAPHAHFVLCGNRVNAENPALSRIISQTGLATRIHLLGEVAETVKVLQALDVLVLPSLYGEGFPNVIGEAMACEVPCITTNVGDAGMLVGDTGRVVPPGCSTRLSLAILDVLGMAPSERRRLGKLARERIASRFALQQVQLAYQTLYREIME